MKIKLSDPKIDIDLDENRIKEIVEDSAYIYKNMYLSTSVFCRLAVISPVGAFFIIPFADKTDVSISDNILQFFSIDRHSAYFFYISDEKSFLLDQYGRDLICLDDFYESFENMYNNLFRPIIDTAYCKFLTYEDLIKEPKIPEEYKESSLNGTKYEYNGQIYQINDDNNIIDSGEVESINTKIDTDTLTRLSTSCEKLEDNERPSNNRKIGDDGRIYVRKTISKRIGGFDTGFVTGAAEWIPVADIDTDKLVLKAAIGGFAGIHKFATGSILSGILYFITAGCCGILPFFDILLYLTGNAMYKVTNYTGKDNLIKNDQWFIIPKPQHKLLAVLGAFLSLIIGYLMMRYVYINLAAFISSIISSNATKAASQTNLFMKGE